MNDPCEKDLHSSYSQALIRRLAYHKVQLVRFVTLDVVNTPRCKAVTVKYLKDSSCPINLPIPFAKVVMAGLPSFADMMIADTGLDAQDTVVLVADVSTLRILPYAPSTAMLLGNLVSQTTGLPSELCTRSLLQ